MYLRPARESSIRHQTLVENRTKKSANLLECCNTLREHTHLQSLIAISQFTDNDIDWHKLGPDSGKEVRHGWIASASRLQISGQNLSSHVSCFLFQPTYCHCSIFAISPLPLHRPHIRNWPCLSCEAYRFQLPCHSSSRDALLSPPLLPISHASYHTRPPHGCTSHPHITYCFTQSHNSFSLPNNTPLFLRVYYALLRIFTFNLPSTSVTGDTPYPRLHVILSRRL